MSAYVDHVPTSYKMYRMAQIYRATDVQWIPDKNPYDEISRVCRSF